MAEDRQQLPPPAAFTPEEYTHLMQSWDPAMRLIAEERLSGNYRRASLKHFSDEEAVSLLALVMRLVPEDEGIDLVGFVDWSLDHALGRGDRAPGMPPEAELFRLGLRGLDEAAQELHGSSFRELYGAEQDSILKQLEAGSAPGAVWQQVRPQYFFERILARVLCGYLSHPRVWMRIGFTGSAYPGGHTWLSLPATEQRHKRAAGWEHM